jgi:hypothetical protein
LENTISPEIVSLLALIVSFVTVCVSAYQAKLARQHSRIAVLPFLDSHTGGLDPYVLKIELLNGGLGPAIIDSMHIKLNDAIYKIESGTWPAELKPICESSGFKYRVGSCESASIMSPGQRITLMSVLHPSDVSRELDENEAADGPYGKHCDWSKNLLRKVEIRISYHSFYGEQRVFIYQPVSARG